MDAQRHREIERVHLFYIIISLFLCLYIYIVYYIISIFHVNCGITIITRWWAGAPSNGSTRHSRPPGLFLFHLFFYDFCFSLISFTKQDCMFVISQCAMCVSSLFHVSHFCRRFDFLVFVSVFCSCCDSDESKKKKKKLPSNPIAFVLFIFFVSLLFVVHSSTLLDVRFGVSHFCLSALTFSVPMWWARRTVIYLQPSVVVFFFFTRLLLLPVAQHSSSPKITHTEKIYLPSECKQR